ncbi:MAG: class I SAM-dependent methyltransferase [Planctomycetes bacterium]|nr:class I SAM-dependent methyltransferase [Planctomycetota bacterium]
MWKSDQNNSFIIDQSAVKKYFDKTMSLVFDDKSAKKEQDALLPYIDLEKKLNVLDLGCANGRWANILVPHCNSYVGVDISEKFIKTAKIKFPQNHCEFFAMPGDKFMTERQFGLILMVGLITYMNDSEIRQLSMNCRNMLEKDGIMVIRNVVLKENEGDRKVFDYKPNLLRRLLRRPAYQVIRRSIRKELELFSNFELVYQSDIEGTGYHFYVFR